MQDSDVVESPDANLEMNIAGAADGTIAASEVAILSFAGNLMPMLRHSAVCS